MKRLSKHSYLLAAVAAAALSFGFAPAAHAQSELRDIGRETYLRTSHKMLHAFAPAVAKPSESVVAVLGDEDKQVALGTVVSKDGFILTKLSELKETIKVKTRDGQEYAARLVGAEKANDLAMLKIDAKGLKPVSFTDSKMGEVGNWVASAGTGEDPVAVGVISVATRTLPAREVGPASTPNPNSGYLGVSLEPANEGPQIKTVSPRSAAEKAGFKVDDVVLEIGGKKVSDPDAMINMLAGTKPGDVVTFKVKRGDDEKEIKATLDKRPASMARGDIQNRMGSDLSNRRAGFPTILQHDTVIKPSDCGGPLVDLDGKVLGVNIARAGRTESYAIPSEVITPLLKDLKSGKLAPPKKDEPAKEEPKKDK